MYKVTYEEIHQVHENCVYSRIKVLNFGRDFASFHMIALLKTALLSPYVFVLLSFSFNLVSFSDCNGYFFIIVIPCKGWTYFI